LTEGPPVVRAALVMVLMVLVHSLLEYPLWYSYFLFPAAFAFGLCLGRPSREAAPAAPAAAREETVHPTRPWLLAAMAMPLVAAVALWDYSRVVVIFAPPPDAGPLEDRIEAGRHSWFFAPHADYAAATTAEHPSTALPSFKVATHYLLDTRLMMAWARALEEAGDDEGARYIAQRLREFRNEASASFFAPCANAAAPAAEVPFQCKAPTRRFTYEDFR
ncbi:MAG TPA: Wzy polymerase domain-containing protein, partial [Caldimonas sp.]|nr:Wzy polymerase domain-containing protein [Caldimonas sp.]